VVQEGKSAPAEYKGLVTIDSRTAEVVRMLIQTDAWPPPTIFCQTAATVDFSQVQIAGEPFLLATGVRQRYVMANGGEVDSMTAMNDCREYSAESTISFGEGAAADGTAAHKRPVVAEIPPNRRFTLDLLSPIDTDKAAAGDRFEARLVEPIRDIRSRIVARAGSVVEGRLLNVESIHHPPPEILLVFAPRAIWIDGQRLPFAGYRDWTKGHRPKGAIVLMPMPGTGPAGVFRFPGQHLIVPKGFRSYWWTARPEVLQQ
jgi:hypothetical protein